MLSNKNDTCNVKGFNEKLRPKSAAITSTEYKSLTLDETREYTAYFMTLAPPFPRAIVDRDKGTAKSNDSYEINEF